jgi:hypothetical protein
MEVCGQLQTPNFQFLTVFIFDIQLVPYDAFNRNKASIREHRFILLLTHYMFRPLRAIFR